MQIRWRRSLIVIGVLTCATPLRLAEAQGLSESTGVGQYFTNCARCHESDEPPLAPRTAVLKQMTPERILEVLTTGTMRTTVPNLSDQDKRLIAEWLGGRKIDTDSMGAAEKMPNVCAAHPPVRRLTAPGWNGWGVDQRNSRAQSATAAGLSPGQVSRLTLKWAFGFPGATALYGQAVIDGRVYVSSNAGYVYSLDAETGCVHWSFRSQAVVRSGFTVGRMSRTSERLVVFFGDIHGTAYGLDASSGELIWKMQTDTHPLARITGTPVLHDGRLYVPVASLEEPESGQADYACCSFRGFLSALDASTGEPIWKTYTIAEAAEGRRQELAREGHAGAGGRRHLGDADSRSETARAVLRHRECLLRHAERPPTRSWRSTWTPARSCGQCRRCRSTSGTTGVRR